MLSTLPHLGVGLGYRDELRSFIATHRAAVDWLELITEHYIQTTPDRRDRATELQEDFILSPHGIEMSIGTNGPVDEQYLDELASLVASINAPWFSDHLSFTRAGGIALGQLTPLTRTLETARQVAKRAQYVQDRVGAPFLLENITYYFELSPTMTESQFITEVLEHCDCGLLLDVANLYINSVNHGFDPGDFLDSIPLERVVQLHLAGGEWSHDTLVDAHGFPVPPEVWSLLPEVVRRCDVKGIIIERDQNFPDDDQELLHDLTRARAILNGVEQQ